jgi:hypothetical protein
MSLVKLTTLAKADDEDDIVEDDEEDPMIFPFKSKLFLQTGKDQELRRGKLQNKEKGATFAKHLRALQVVEVEQTQEKVQEVASKLLSWMS